MTKMSWRLTTPSFYKYPQLPTIWLQKIQGWFKESMTRMDIFLKNVCRIWNKNHYDMYKSKGILKIDRNQYYGKSAKKLYQNRISF